MHTRSARPPPHPLEAVDAKVDRHGQVAQQRDGARHAHDAVRHHRVLNLGQAHDVDVRAEGAPEGTARQRGRRRVAAVRRAAAKASRARGRSCGGAPCGAAAAPLLQRHLVQRRGARGPRVGGQEAAEWAGLRPCLLRLRLLLPGIVVVVRCIQGCAWHHRACASTKQRVVIASLQIQLHCASRRLLRLLPCAARKRIERLEASCSRR
jgi:hypothetical protein